MISIISAVTENGVIGNKNDLPWYLAADLKRFSEITKPHTVIMGRKTYESIISRIGKSLPQRTNIIITRQKDLEAPGCTIVSSVDEALALPGEKFVIGGEEIFKLFISHADRMYITRIHANIDGDAKFPEYNESEWAEISRENHSKDEKNQYDYSFLVYERKK